MKSKDHGSMFDILKKEFGTPAPEKQTKNEEISASDPDKNGENEEKTGSPAQKKAPQNAAAPEKTTLKSTAKASESSEPEKTAEKTVHKEETTNSEKVNPDIETLKVPMSIRISGRYNVFIQIMSARNSMTINDYMTSLIQKEEERVREGNGPDAFEVHFQIPTRENVVQKHILLPKDLADFLDKQSRFLGLKKSQYVNYILEQESKGSKEAGNGN